MCRDVAASIAFYERLGFAVLFTDGQAEPRYAGIGRDAVELHLQWQDAGQWAHGGDRPSYRFVAGDVDALHDRWLRAGALADATPVADTPWGTREFHVRDPGGNVLQFYAPREPAT
jgi:catechol 2,3-dioxygenase-like lactoylglutathione lyase family enzyme